MLQIGLRLTSVFNLIIVVMLWMISKIDKRLNFELDMKPDCLKLKIEIDETWNRKARWAWENSQTGSISWNNLRQLKIWVTCVKWEYEIIWVQEINCNLWQFVYLIFQSHLYVLSQWYKYNYTDSYSFVIEPVNDQQFTWSRIALSLWTSIKLPICIRMYNYLTS